MFCFVFDSFLNCVVFCSSSLATSERSSLLGCSLKVAFKSFAKLTGKYPHRSRPETLLRKRICNKYFPVFYKIFLDLFYGTFPGACSIVITRILNFFLGFLSSNLPDVYLWVFWFTLHVFLLLIE